VKRALARETAPEYKREKRINADIEPFCEFIKESYLVKKYRVSRILKDLQSKGFTAGRSALYRYIEKELKPQRVSQNTKSYQPYETQPGEHFIYDWSEYAVAVGGATARVYVHPAILGFSRKKVFSGSLAVQQSDVLEALEESFHQNKGVCERLQVDNARVFVDNASREHFRWNRRFLDFCGFYGIKPTRSLPYRPWSKGKVENPFSYLQTHFIQGGRFDTFEDFLSKLKRFELEVNNSIHSVTRKKPSELFELESKVLLPLPVDAITGQPKRYVGCKEEFRKVTSDCLICYGGNRYSVPHYFARSEVWVRVSKGIYLQICSQKNNLIATHRLSMGKGEVILEKEHYRGHRNTADRNGFDFTARKLRDRFWSSYTAIEEFIQSAKAQKRISPSYNLQRIAGIFEHFHLGDCIMTMQNCFRYNCFSASFIQGFITHNAKSQLAVSAKLFPWAEYPPIPTQKVKRDLKEYRL
jgi:transposase